jgi:RNA polymerase sigma factor (sigma-70 family)
VSSTDPNPNRVNGLAVFATTRWSVVLAAGGGSSEESERALAHLCRTYWYPLYAFVRRQGRSPEDAEDLTQGFFAHLLEKKVLRGVEPERGKFRSFLLALLKNFLANDWDRKRAAKRGGGQPMVSWNDESLEDRYLHEPTHEATPEKRFDQNWALTVIDTVSQQLRTEYAASGKAELFEALQDQLIGAEDAGSYAQLALRLGMKEGAIRMAVMRLRRHFKSLFRAEIAQTVADPADLEGELRYLIAASAG